MKKKQFLSRGSLVIAIFVCLLLGLFFHLYYLQIVKYPQFYKKAQRQHYFTFQAEMERGMIFDCHGKPLAISVEVDSIYAVPKKIKDSSSCARKLKKIINKDYRWIKKQLEKDSYFVWLARKIDPQCSQTLKDLNLEGVGLLKEYKRFYPQENLAAHLLGFVGIDNQGLEGIERHYESVLSVPPRKYIVKRDALGQKIIFEEEKLSSKKASDLILTIDATIQHIAEKELDRVFQETGAKGAQIVIMRPRTGEILALANRPTFSPNCFNQYSPIHWRNRVVTDIYEPGSSFKIISAAAALEEGIVVPQDKFFCENGSFEFCGRIIHDHEPRRWLTFGEIVKYSNNIGITKVSLLLGKKKLSKRLEQFGFGEYTGVDMPGEVKGILRPVSQWTKSSLGAIPYGQEISVTSIQLINAVSTVANGGLMMQPFVIKEIRDGNGNSVKKFNPRIKRRVISSSAAKVLREILEEAVDSGTGSLARISDYRVAGKTGTAQKFDPDLGKYSPDKFVVSFVGFAPGENPAVAVLVMVDEPKGEAWGGTIAAPVFCRVVKKILSYLRISPREGGKTKVTSKVIKEGKRAVVSGISKGQQAKMQIKEDLQIMPDLKGQTIRESLEKLSPLNLNIRIEGSGFLSWQRPPAGKKLNPETPCFLKFSPSYYGNVL